MRIEWTHVPQVVAVCLALAGCGDGDDNGTTPAQNTATGGTTVEVVATDFEFTPNRITVAPGENLTVLLRNEGDDPHNIEFEIGEREYELEEDLAPGEEGQLTFTVPNDTGEFEFYCPVGNHRELGMTGTLTIEE